jgi:hypothetical protein
MPDTWEAVPDTEMVFMQAIPVDTLVDDCTITLRVQAQNEAFPSDTVRASIIFDSISPILGSFTVDRNGASDEWSVICQPEDPDPCKSGIAGIVIKDETATTRTERWLYLQGSDRSISFADPESGLHRLEAFAVDNADVNQNKVSAEFETLAKLADYLTGSENGIDHPSEKGQDSVWVLRNVTYNFPNPFNPEMEKTKIKVDRENVSSVDVRIFDLFGNLVYDAFNVSSTDGTSNLIVEWHGKNGNDEIVASGTYLAVITLDNGETLDPIKIGVLRKSRQ